MSTQPIVEVLTAADAEAWCTANSTCRAFTYEGPPDAVRRNPEVIRAYLGSGATHAAA